MTNYRTRRKGSRIPFLAVSRSSRDAIWFPFVNKHPSQSPRHRVALVGEAAHVLPPIGAQGLNMGLRDAAGIADIVREAMSSGEDPGSPQVLDRYNSARRADVASRTFVIDMANRSLLSDFIPIQLVRAAGLHLIGAIGPLRRIAMREGLAPTWHPRRGSARLLSRRPA